MTCPRPAHTVALWAVAALAAALTWIARRTHGRRSD